MEVSEPRKQSRRRVEMKRVEEDSKRLVTFAKRRKGLFNKAWELSELSGAKIGLFVISGQGKPYSCGDVDSLIEQYLTGKVTEPGPESPEVELMRKELLKLKEEEEKKKKKKGFWWEKTAEEWLMEYEVALVQLKTNVEAKLEEMRRSKTNAKASTSSSASPGAVDHDGFIHDENFGVDDFVGFDDDGCLFDYALV